MKQFLFLLLLSLAAIAPAQESNLGNWLIYFGDKKIDARWNWHHEAQYRNYNAIGDLEQLLLRTGIGYNLTENNNNVLLGYAYILSRNYAADNETTSISHENRIFQQFITRQRIGRVHLLHRYRFEQRFFKTAFELRFRYFLALNLPLNNPEMTDRTFYLSSYNEIFINGQNEPFDRNRLYGGLGYRLNDALRFELGYMNQFLADGGRDQINVITFFNF